LDYFTSPTSFHIWIPLQPGVSSTEKTAELYSLNVSVADGADSATVDPQNGFIRVALAAEKEDLRLREALEIVRSVLTGSK
jgi:DNA-binding transcriptional MocR family regulator